VILWFWLKYVKNWSHTTSSYTSIISSATSIYFKNSKLHFSKRIKIEAMFYILLLSEEGGRSAWYCCGGDGGVDGGWQLCLSFSVSFATRCP